MKKILSLLLCFVLVLSMSISAFAAVPSDIPSPFSVWSPEYQDRFPFALITKNSTGAIHLRVSSNQPYFQSGPVNPYLTIDKVSGDLTYLEWTLNKTDGVWSNYAGYSEEYKRSHDTVIATNFDLYYGTTLNHPADTDFFYNPPLWETVGGVTTATLPNLMTATATNLSILVACGIGCLAFLTGLYLLAKRFPLFLG